MPTKIAPILDAPLRSAPGHRNPRTTGAQRLFTIVASCDQKGGGVTKRGAHPAYRKGACITGLMSAFGVANLAGMMEPAR